MATIEEQTGRLARFGEILPGELFYACGDLAIKTEDGRGVFLRDGRYVVRNDDDLTELPHGAKLEVTR